MDISSENENRYTMNFHLSDTQPAFAILAGQQVTADDPEKEQDGPEEQNEKQGQGDEEVQSVNHDSNNNNKKKKTQNQSSNKKQQHTHHRVSFPILKLPMVFGRTHITQDTHFLGLGNGKALSRNHFSISYRDTTGGKFEQLQPLQDEFTYIPPPSSSSTSPPTILHPNHTTLPNHGFYVLESLGRNKIFVDKQRIEQGQIVLLNHGSTIKFASFCLYFLLPQRSNDYVPKEYIHAEEEEEHTHVVSSSSSSMNKKTARKDTAATNTVSPTKNKVMMTAAAKDSEKITGKQQQEVKKRKKLETATTMIQPKKKKQQQQQQSKKQGLLVNQDNDNNKDDDEEMAHKEEKDEEGSMNSTRKDQEYEDNPDEDMDDEDEQELDDSMTSPHLPPSASTNMSSTMATPSYSSSSSLSKIELLDCKTTLELFQVVDDLMYKGIFNRTLQNYSSAIMLHGIRDLCQDPIIQESNFKEKGLSKDKISIWLETSRLYGPWFKFLKNHMKSKSFDSNLTRALLKLNFGKHGTSGRYVHWIIPEILLSSVVRAAATTTKIIKTSTTTEMKNPTKHDPDATDKSDPWKEEGKEDGE